MVWLDPPVCGRDLRLVHDEPRLLPERHARGHRVEHHLRRAGAKPAVRVDRPPVQRVARMPVRRHGRVAGQQPEPAVRAAERGPRRPAVGRAGPDDLRRRSAERVVPQRPADLSAAFLTTRPDATRGDHPAVAPAGDARLHQAGTDQRPALDPCVPPRGGIEPEAERADAAAVERVDPHPLVTRLRIRHRRRVGLVHRPGVGRAQQVTGVVALLAQDARRCGQLDVGAVGAQSKLGPLDRIGPPVRGGIVVPHESRTRIDGARVTAPHGDEAPGGRGGSHSGRHAEHHGWKWPLTCGLPSPSASQSSTDRASTPSASSLPSYAPPRSW